MEILAIFNAKGGVGKTTTAVNLAACFAAIGRRVVVFDLDSQGNATTSLGAHSAPKIGSYDVIVGQAPITEAVRPTFMTGLSLVGATKNLVTADVDMAMGEARSGVIRRMIEPIAADTDILVLDCAPTFGSTTINALVSADAVLIPSQPNTYAHDGLLRTWTILGRVRTELQPRLRILGIVPTFQTDADDEGATEILAAMRAEFGNLVHPTGIPTDTALFTSATAIGVPACVLSPVAAACTAYLDLTLQLAGGDRCGPLRYLDDTGDIDPQRRDAALERLQAWHDEAEGNGMFAERANVPAVDEQAMKMAEDPAMSLDRDLAQSGGSRAPQIILGAGLALLCGLIGFLLGWTLKGNGL